MQDKEYIVFVEVKAVSRKSNYSIYDRLSAVKIKKLRRAIDIWLAKNDKNDSLWRVDFVGITFGEKVDFYHQKFLSVDNIYSRKAH